MLDITVLYVEDEESARAAIAATISRRVAKLLTAKNGREGLDAFRSLQPDIVITDIMMPVMDGLAMAREIKALNNKTQIIVTTAHNETGYFLDAIDLGIDRFVLKPIDQQKLIVALESCTAAVLHEREVQRHNREREKLISELETALTTVRKQTDEMEGMNKLLKDEIVERRSLEVKLRDLAERDSLTFIYNRRRFFELMNQEIERAKRYGRQLSLIMFDLDHFKTVNDTYGHIAGDTVLQAVSQIVNSIIRKNDIFARYGGEEFIILSPEAEIGSAVAIAEKLRLSIEQHLFPEAGRITISVGVAAYAKEDPEDFFIKKADEALYAAKKDGRNKVKTWVSHSR
jgi:two-component system cell cycle response regulator